MPIYKIQAGRIITVTSYDWVGPAGTIWYDEVLGDLRLGDGVTPGGRLLQFNGSGSGITITGSVSNSTQLETSYAGDSGDGFIADDTGNLWVWDGARWVDVGKIQGPIGFTGSQGDIGYAGSRGDTGYTGSQGNLGYTGSTGVIGYTGSLGYTGSQGYTGSTGAGFTGSQGDTGFVGSQGDIGYTGSAGAGFTGSAGTNGYTGSAGLSAYEIAAVNGFSGTEQEWLDSLGGSLTVEPNAGLEITSSTITTVYNTLISDDVQSIAVGGAAAQPASAWKSKNIVEVLDTILFPDVAPTYTIPTISISGTQSGTKEIGSTVSQSLVLTTVKNDAGVFTALAITKGGTSIASSSNPTGSSAPNIAEQFGYSNPNNPNYSYSLSASESVTVINGSISWSGSGTYGAGLPKQNNKGVTDTRTAAVRSTSAPQSASSISASTITVTGIYPYFWGKSSTQPSASSIAAAILAGTANRVLSAANGTVTVTYGAVGEYIWLAHIASYTTKTKWYNTELNQGNIGAGNFILAPVTQAVNSPDAYWSNINFSIYISDGATVTDGAIQFRNS